MRVDAVVIGAGHAGCEAALALAKRNHSVVAAVMNMEYVASMPCNPSIGGPAKGVVVREIDSLGGMMGKIADKTALQYKMLNGSKGPGVRCIREQSDKIEYRHTMRQLLLDTPNITVKEGVAEQLVVEDNKVKGVKFEDGELIECKVIILTTGTYLSSKVMVSDQVTISGPEDQKTTFKLGDSIRELGLRTIRLKTGTPPRVKTSSIDFSNLAPQPGNITDEGFSYETKLNCPIEKQELCYLTYTTEETHKLIRDNLKKSSMYSGIVKGVGPRYCPSIEDKIVRFSDKPRHQLFLEPESKSLDTTYVQGFSTSMPHEIQEKMVHSVPGLEKAEIEKWSYAIEYDAIDPLQLKYNLETKNINGLFCAGQTNGTSGYEEAAGQGLMAGINAANYLEHKPSLILHRDEAYIGVLIDDLVTKGTKEPYRLMTSRAEYRLLIRHDNADQRLTDYGYKQGLISEERYHLFQNKMNELKKAKKLLKETKLSGNKELNDYLVSKDYLPLNGSESLEELTKRPNIELSKLLAIGKIQMDPTIVKQAEIETCYAGYIEKEKREASHLKQLEKLKLPLDWDYSTFDQLSLEARQKLNAVHPVNIGQASRISGVDPTDIAILVMELKQKA